jgi:hypothetical protein
MRERFGQISHFLGSRHGESTAFGERASRIDPAGSRKK